MKIAILLSIQVAAMSILAYGRPIESPRAAGQWVRGYSIERFEESIVDSEQQQKSNSARGEAPLLLAEFPKLSRWLELKKSLGRIEEVWLYELEIPIIGIGVRFERGYAAIADGRIVSYLDEIYLSIRETRTI